MENKSRGIEMMEEMQKNTKPYYYPYGDYPYENYPCRCNRCPCCGGHKRHYPPYSPYYPNFEGPITTKLQRYN